MRLRNVPGSRDVLAASPYVVHEFLEHRGRWAQDIFENSRPVHMEIGTGKGRFLTELARRNPEVNYLGVEQFASVLVRALARLEEEPLPNIRFLCLDAEDLPAYMAEGEIGRLYLNFSDPWPKERHAKRRLTSARFLSAYEKFLAPGGVLEFKTDNKDLFAWSLETIPAQGWRLLAVTHDLHRDPVLNEGNIMTEYEEKFSALGEPICKLIAERP